MPDEILGYQTEVSLEPNRETMDEITKAGDAATLTGGDPRRAVHEAAMKYNPKEHPDRFDYVVYHRATLGRPSVLMPDRTPTAFVRLGEFLRVPYADLRARADAMFAGRESPPAQMQ